MARIESRVALSPHRSTGADAALVSRRCRRKLERRNAVPFSRVLSPVPPVDLALTFSIIPRNYSHIDSFRFSRTGKDTLLSYSFHGMQRCSKIVAYGAILAGYILLVVNNRSGNGIRILFI